jgi:hypothetical protein
MQILSWDRDQYLIPNLRRGRCPSRYIGWLAVLRRSQKHRMTWGRIAGIANRFLPRARILHPWPEARFAVTHPS